MLNGSYTKQCNKVYYKNIWTSFISMNWSSFAQIFMLNMDPLMRSLICSRLEMFSSNDKMLTPYRKSCIFISQMIAMKFFRGRCVNTYLWVETYWPVSNVFWTQPRARMCNYFKDKWKNVFSCYNFALLACWAKHVLLCCSVCALSLWTLK